MTLNMNARADSVTRIKPILVRKTMMDNLAYWWVSIPYGDSVTLLFPCHLYTHEDAVRSFCETKGISFEDTIIKVEED